MGSVERCIDRRGSQSTHVGRHPLWLLFVTRRSIDGGQGRFSIILTVLAVTIGYSGEFHSWDSHSNHPSGCSICLSFEKRQIGFATGRWPGSPFPIMSYYPSQLRTLGQSEHLGSFLLEGREDGPLVLTATFQNYTAIKKKKEKKKIRKKTLSSMDCNKSSRH